MIHHGDAETRSKLLHKGLTEQIMGASIEVHRALGPGLLESAYEECLCHEFNIQGIVFRPQVPLPVLYKGVNLDCGYRLDIIVDGCGDSRIEVPGAHTACSRSATAELREDCERARRTPSEHPRGDARERGIVRKVL